MNILETYKEHIGEKLKKIRRDRQLSQQNLSGLLDISQAQFSKIESGKQSLTAEQFLYLIEKFNLSIDQFVKEKKLNDITAILQNALIQLGATHLRQVPHIIVPQKYLDYNEVIIETLLLAPSSRLITALAPVIIKNYSEISYHLIIDRLETQKLTNRFGWVLEATWRKIYTGEKAYYLLERKLLDLGHPKKNKINPNEFFEDTLDRDILTEKTLNQVLKNRDYLAKKWHIITRLKIEDFEKALIEANVNDR